MTATITKTKKEIKTIIQNELHPDTIGTKRGTGNILCRWGFFYTHGKTAEYYASKVEDLLTMINVNHMIVDCGKVWKNFRGGTSIANSSHFWVEIELL